MDIEEKIISISEEKVTVISEEEKNAAALVFPQHQKSKRKILKRPKKWSTLFLVMAAFQLIFALAFLVPCLINARKINNLSEDFGTDDLSKGFKVSGEYLMYILFELWRLLLAIDGVIQTNSRTIYASASFSIFALGWNIMMVEEAVFLTHVNNSMNKNNVELHRLIFLNQNLLITLGCIVIVFLPPNFMVATKVAEDFGWDLYKKIGSNIKIQQMYLRVNWFSLMLKIDCYFEFMAYVLLFSSWAGQEDNWTEREGVVALSTMLVSIILLVPSFVIARLSISMESHVMMTLFIILQLLFLASAIYIIIVDPQILSEWYAFTLYCAGVLLAVTSTILLSVMCQVNFGKGLKEHVYWKPFTKKTAQQTNQATAHGPETLIDDESSV